KFDTEAESSALVESTEQTIDVVNDLDGCECRLIRRVAAARECATGKLRHSPLRAGRRRRRRRRRRIGGGIAVVVVILRDRLGRRLVRRFARNLWVFRAAAKFGRNDDLVIAQSPSRDIRRRGFWGC